MLIYDCEIIKAIPNRDGSVATGYEYCEGWHDHKNMGVSVVGCYDYAEDRYRVFCKDNFIEFFELFASTDLAVGFNNIAFDDLLLLKSEILLEENNTPRYDLLRETWIAVGVGPEWKGPKTHGGYGLDAICEATLGEKKSGHGASAPLQWQRGEIGAVIDYCLMDVRLTKKLFDLVLAGKSIVDPKTGDGIVLRNPI